MYHRSHMPQSPLHTRTPSWLCTCPWRTQCHAAGVAVTASPAQHHPHHLHCLPHLVHKTAAPCSSHSSNLRAQATKPGQAGSQRGAPDARRAQFNITFRHLPVQRLMSRWAQRHDRCVALLFAQHCLTRCPHGLRPEFPGGRIMVMEQVHAQCRPLKNAISQRRPTSQ